MFGPNSLLCPGGIRGFEETSVADFDKLFAVNVRADLLGQLEQLTNVSYGVAHQDLLIAANQKLTWSSTPDGRAAMSSPGRDQPDAEGARPRAVARIETEIVDLADEYAEASMGSTALTRFCRKSWASGFRRWLQSCHHVPVRSLSVGQGKSIDHRQDAPLGGAAPRAHVRAVGSM